MKHQLNIIFLTHVLSIGVVFNCCLFYFGGEGGQGVNKERWIFEKKKISTIHVGHTTFSASLINLPFPKFNI